MSKMIMLVGLPASGKSSYAKIMSEGGFKIHSSDSIREELFGDVNFQGDNALVFKTLHKRIKDDLICGINVVYDATNLSYKKRKGFLEELRSIDCTKTAVIVATPYNDCIDRDSKRERRVGSTVLERMYKSFTMPSKMEGFSKIEIVYSKESYPEFDWSKDFSFLRNIGQNNTNHTKTIGMHCYAVSQLLTRESDELYMAGMLHDYGKLKTMSFKDSKGRFSTQCHYYSHEAVSSYDAMFYTKNEYVNTIKVCQLINFHMKPHLLKTEKSINKFKRFCGEEFWDELLILNKADKEAR